MTFVVVRTGRNVAQLTVPNYDMDGPAVPPLAVIKAQITKLSDARYR